MTLAPDNPMVAERTAQYVRKASDELASRVDRMFVWLLALEWLGLVGLAWVTAPRTWSGNVSSLHPHLIAALVSGPLLIWPAIAAGLLYPARALTRQAIAVSQMMVSIILIDVSGGRIESHFHIFGSLAFLALYRDWRVLLTASAITAADHVVRGIWFPETVFGALTVSPWRWVEHVWWVVFEDCFLIMGGRKSIAEMRDSALSKAQLYAGAYHDVLTGLGNRRLLQERFDAISQAQTGNAAVLFLDLDRFKQANDTLGHAAGDKLLVALATRLAHVVKSTDTLARIGGDEFVVLVPAISGTDDALVVGSRLLDALAAPFAIDGHELMLSASVGISLYPEHGIDLPRLQERADQAMYTAKARGRNGCSVFSADIAAHEDSLREIARDIDGALERGELSLQFQPLVERDGQLAAFEALLRWTHPAQGEIAPSDFIPLAERCGAIVPIGAWVLAEACRNCCSWKEGGGRTVGVAVNVSAVQFEQPDFPARVLKTLADSGLDPSLLTLELTESVLLRDLPRARQQLTGLRNAGVRIALDDFGTGYSSLSYLTSIPADTIKLDHTFVNREFANTTAVLESVIDMAHKVGLRVVGEGVETGTQNKRMLALECDELQGFYFSRPMAPDAVRGYIEAREHESAAMPELAYSE